tara:strand:+ start:1051 stop:1986 length:936 start_codon:yes stop_codon:yes gene_type:complete
MHKYGIKGREIVAKTSSGTAKISTFGWLYQLSTASWYDESGEIERREDAASNLFEKRATMVRDNETGHVSRFLPYVIETRDDNGAPDKTEVYPVRANCPHRFFTEAWSESGGEESFGELVGYLKHDGKRWHLVNTFTKQGGSAHVTVKFNDGTTEAVKVPVRYTTYGISYANEGPIVPTSYSVLGVSCEGLVIENKGREASDQFYITVKFDELPKAAQEKAKSDALEIVADRERRKAEHLQQSIDRHNKAKRAAQLREIEKLESDFGLAEAAARAAQKELLAARRKLNRPPLPPLPAPTLPKGAALPPLPV